MRTLVFTVKNQIIQRDISCDFSGLVAGTTGYLRAKFSFSEDWNGCAKVAGFFLKDGTEFQPCVLDSDNSCFIPEEILKYHEFNVKLFGKKTNYTITTRPITIKQYGGIQ